MHPTPDTVGDRSLDELAIRACTNLPRSVDESVGDDCRSYIFWIYPKDEGLKFNRQCQAVVSGDDEQKTETRTEDREGRGDTRDFVGDSFAGGHYLDECL